MTNADIARNEIALLNRLFQHRKIRAKIIEDGSGSLIAPQFWAYRVHLDTRQAPEGVLALHKSIAEIITNSRSIPTPIRFQLAPLAIEVPSTQPSAIDWKKADWSIGPGKILAGQSFSLFNGAQPLLLSLSTKHHILIGGMSGAGKSTLLQMMVLSSALNSSPQKYQLWLIDRRNAELVDLAGLPHVAACARTEEESYQLVVNLQTELERRIEQRIKFPHIRLVIDELAALNGNKEICAIINDILNRGRGNGIGSLLATQHPTQKAIGNISLINITARCIGAVTDATTAHFATGRAETGAQFLPLRSGSFLYIDGQEIQRFQSYFVPEDEVPQAIDRVRQRWPAADRRPTITLQPTPAAQPDPIPAHVVETFRDYYDPEADELKRGGLSAIITALFGSGTSTGGAYRIKAQQVVAQLKATKIATTTAYTAQISRYQPKTGPREE